MVISIVYYTFCYGLRQILLRKPLTEVTVADINTDCNISRTTFYRNFNKPNVGKSSWVFSQSKNSSCIC